MEGPGAQTTEIIIDCPSNYSSIILSFQSTATSVASVLDFEQSTPRSMSLQAVSGPSLLPQRSAMSHRNSLSGPITGTQNDIPQ